MEQRRFRRVDKKGIKIEVFLGQNDKIIDSLDAKEFLKSLQLFTILKIKDIYYDCKNWNNYNK